ncbi:MAG: hypothetical protein IT357_16375 [Gemmatimonadaceae bacterium]|jgi:hypothetical protein|nr:hypothetical protein [Gemmatimonadaceae bacterium]
MNQIPTVVYDELKRGNKIGAIRELRAVKNMSLVDAKNQVEAWVSADPELQRQMFESSSMPHGPLGFLAFVIVMVGVLVLATFIYFGY